MNQTFSLTDTDFRDFIRWSKNNGYEDNYNYNVKTDYTTETSWQNGPVIEALQRGAILLLDEIDLASNKIMVLQSVMEGKPLFLKKISKLIHPKAGFNIIATANTKGKGSDDGRFIGTSVMNEAFLERFSVTFEQAYPSPAIETKILTKIAKLLNVVDDEFIKKLVDWGDSIRKTFYEGGVDEIISTRRLVHIIKAYAIFGNKSKAIKIATNRFDDCVKTAFLNLYNTLDEHFNLDSSDEKEGVDETESV